MKRDSLAYFKPLYKRNFTSNDMKSAYMKAVKWLATNIYSKVELSGIAVKISKSQEQYPTVAIVVGVVIDNKDIFEEHCNICKELHKSFFINEQNDCTRCSAKGFVNRVNSRIDIKKQYYKETIKKNMEE